MNTVLQAGFSGNAGPIPAGLRQNRLMKKAGVTVEGQKKMGLALMGIGAGALLGYAALAAKKEVSRPMALFLGGASLAVMAGDRLLENAKPILRHFEIERWAESVREKLEQAFSAQSVNR